MEYKLYKHCLLYSFAPHKERKLNKIEIRNMLREHSALMLQNCYNWDCGYTTNFWYIIADNYDESKYSKKTRKYIKKANEKFEIRLISKERFLREGFDVYRSAYNAYTVRDGYKETPASFINRIKRMTDLHEIWGCIDRDTNKLEAYSICRIDNDVCFFESSKANPAFLSKYYPMYGMYDARNRLYLKEKNFRYVLSSARSVTNHSNIQNFLIEKMNFRKAYCDMNLHYVWYFHFFVAILYPFRRFIKYSKVKNLLNLEAIRREKVR